MFVYLRKYKLYIQNLSLYFLASLIPMFLQVISNPFFAMNLSPEDYAIIGYYTSLNVLFAPLITFYLLHYYMKRFFEISEEERFHLRSTIFKMLLLFSFVLTLLSIIIIFIYITYFNRQSQIAFFPYAILSALLPFFNGIFQLQLVDYKMQYNSKSYFKISILSPIISLAMSLLLVVVIKGGATGKMAGILIGPIILYIWCIKNNKSYLEGNFDWQLFKKIILFCWPLTIAAMLGFFSGGYDKVFLERTVSIQELGYYSVGVSIASYLNIFSTAISDTFGPDVYQSVAKRNIKKCFYLVCLKVTLISVVVLLFELLAPYIVTVLTAGRYIESVKYCTIVALSSITSVIYYSLSQITIALGYNKIPLINRIIVSICCILMYSVLIEKYGATGAAWGIVISFLLFFLGNLILILIYKYKQVRLYVWKQ